ncbi:MAG: NADH-quinone oxidoreductase subunit K [Deltaproteobacteria bacterium]|nr:NADH-quinone oxidoreductase subunit K [Deltaproteobacteria bacterium]
MIDLEVGSAGLLVVGALMLFWVGMLGLLWRRSLVGMLVGLLFAWISVALAGIGFSALRGTTDARALGGVLVLCSAVLGGLQIAVGLGIVIARIKRRGTLDADDAGLLEG